MWRPWFASLVTNDLTRADLRLVLSNGDNTAMREVVDRVDAYLVANPRSDGLVAVWAAAALAPVLWTLLVVYGVIGLPSRKCLGLKPEPRPKICELDPAPDGAGAPRRCSGRLE